MASSADGLRPSSSHGSGLLLAHPANEVLPVGRRLLVGRLSLYSSASVFSSVRSIRVMSSLRRRGHRRSRAAPTRPDLPSRCDMASVERRERNNGVSWRAENAHSGQGSYFSRVTELLGGQPHRPRRPAGRRRSHRHAGRDREAAPPAARTVSRPAAARPGHPQTADGAPAPQPIRAGRLRPPESDRGTGLRSTRHPAKRETAAPTRSGPGPRRAAAARRLSQPPQAVRPAGNSGPARPHPGLT